MKPCVRCGATERYADGDCAPCKRTASIRLRLAKRAVTPAYWEADEPCSVCGSVGRNRERRCVSCVREYGRQWRKNNPELYRAQQARDRERYPERHRRRWRDYMARTKRQNVVRDRTPGMARAHRMVAAALKRGDLIRPDRCSQCDVVCKPDAAHFDYQEPLRVRWLCRKCHLAWDVAAPKSQAAYAWGRCR